MPRALTLPAALSGQPFLPKLLTSAYVSVQLLDEYVLVPE